MRTQPWTPLRSYYCIRPTPRLRALARSYHPDVSPSRELRDARPACCPLRSCSPSSVPTPSSQPPQHSLCQHPLCPPQLSRGAAALRPPASCESVQYSALAPSTAQAAALHLSDRDLVAVRGWGGAEGTREARLIDTGQVVLGGRREAGFRAWQVGGWAVPVSGVASSMRRGLRASEGRSVAAPQALALIPARWVRPGDAGSSQA